MRYLMAKRLLFDLSVLVCQLHPFCSTAAEAVAAWLPSPVTTSTANGVVTSYEQHLASNNGRRRFSPPPSSSPLRRTAGGGPSPLSGSTGSEPSTRSGSCAIRYPTRRRPVLTLRRKTIPTGCNLSGPSSPLPELAGRIADLVEAVLLHPGPPSSPLPYSGTGGAGPQSNAAEVSATATATAPVISRRAEKLCRGTLAGTIAWGPLPPAQTPASRQLSSSERVAGTGGGGGGGISVALSGAAKVVGSLVSLLAAIVSAEDDRRRQHQEQEEEKETDQQQQQQYHAPSQSQVLDRAEGGKRWRGKTPLTATALSPSLVGSRGTATAPMTTVTTATDGLLRLAFVVVRAANLAFLLDLNAMQVCLYDLFFVPSRCPSVMHESANAGGFPM